MEPWSQRVMRARELGHHMNHTGTLRDDERHLECMCGAYVQSVRDVVEDNIDGLRCTDEEWMRSNLTEEELAPSPMPGTDDFGM